MTGLSGRRQRELSAMDRATDHIVALILAEDTQEPSLFDAEGRRALRSTVYTVVEVELVFRKLQRLRTARARMDWVEYLCTSIRSAMRWHEEVKASVVGVPGVRPLHSDRLPPSVRAIVRAHSRLYRRLWLTPRRAEDLLSVLLELIRLELLWLGHMW